MHCTRPGPLSRSPRPAGPRSPLGAVAAGGPLNADDLKAGSAREHITCDLGIGRQLWSRWVVGSPCYIVRKEAGGSPHEAGGKDDRVSLVLVQWGIEFVACEWLSWFACDTHYWRAS